MTANAVDAAACFRGCAIGDRVLPGYSLPRLPSLP